MSDISNFIREINSISKCKPVTIGIEIYYGYYLIYWRISSSLYKKTRLIDETKNPNDLLDIIILNVPEGYTSSGVQVWSKKGPHYITFHKAGY